MPRILLILVVLLGMLPTLAQAQVPDPASDSKTAAEEARMKKLAEEEAKKLKIAREEAMRKEQAEQEAAKKKAEEAMRKELAEMEARKRQEESSKKIKKVIVESGQASDGLLLLQIPVTGPFYLGMRKTEYDSTALITTTTITTDQRIYALAPDPAFYKERLYLLSLSPADSLFPDPLPDLTAFYLKKFDQPDLTTKSDTVLVFPNERDSSLRGNYRVKEDKYTWLQKTHDVTLHYWLVELESHRWKGYWMLRYTGTVEYVKALGRLKD